MTHQTVLAEQLGAHSVPDHFTELSTSHLTVRLPFHSTAATRTDSGEPVRPRAPRNYKSTTHRTPSKTPNEQNVQNVYDGDNCRSHWSTFSPLEEQLITVAHLSSPFIMFYLPVGHLWVGRKGKSQPAVSLQR
ncbi:uncharacterized protein AB9X84_005550 isoform 1-T1 [Acanthopagrus schlegelii]